MARAVGSGGRRHRLLTVCVAVAAACAFACGAGAQGAFTAGQTVEAKSYFYNPPWRAARILSVGTDCPYAASPYKVHFTGDDAGNHGDPCVGADEIRAAAAAPAPIGAWQPADGPPSSRYGVGARVDVWAPDNRDKGQRGTIIEAAGNRFKVHYDGCEPHRDAWVEIEALHPAAAIGADAPEIRFLVGDWAMFTPSYPNTVVAGNTIYREYGVGGRAPPLQLRADGTYTWYFDYGKAPVKGRWTPHARIDGVRYTTEVNDGVIIAAPDGALWKVYRRRYPEDGKDHITAQTLCSGMTVIGTRL